MTTKVGVLLDSTDIPAWQLSVVESLTKSPSICPVFIYLESPGRQVHNSLGWLYDRFEEFDRAREEIQIDALTVASTNDITRGHPFVTLPVDHSLHPLTNTDELAALSLDVIIALAVPIDIEYFSATAKHGLWFYWHDYGQTMIPTGRTVGFWEVIKRRPDMQSALLVSEPASPNYRIAYKTSSTVHTRSHCRTRSEHLWKISQYVVRALERLSSTGPAFLEQRPTANRNLFPIRDDKRWWISNRRILWPVLAFVINEFFSRLRRRIYQEHWILMLGHLATKPTLAAHCF